MQILTVAPIMRGALQGSLTYFSKDSASIGSVIMVPVRNREIPALVLEIKEVQDAKALLRASDYTIRKIAHPKTRSIWTSQFTESATETARLSAQGLGETLLALTPKTILDEILADNIISDTTYQTPTNAHFEILAMQESTRHRIESYQRLIRESFVRNESVFIAVPTSEDAIALTETLKHGIEDYTFAYYSTLSKKRVIENWQKALAETHAILVIATAQYLSLPRYFRTIILEDEHSRSWKTVVRPLIDMRVFAEEYARRAKSRLIFCAPILRAETHQRIRENEIGEFTRIALHARALTETRIVDPRLEERVLRERTGKRAFQILAHEIREFLIDAQNKSERTLLISARKGLSPITVCSDCGTVVRCPQCEAPLVIHRREKGNAIFSCHACGFMRAPEDGEHETCTTCQGWRLEGLGIGTERIEEEIGNLFPHTPCFVFDGDLVKTPAQARKLITQFEKTENGILIATPMVTPYVTSISRTAIVSIDALFAIPDIRMNERIFALILALREKTTATLLTQTRTDDTTLITQALSGDLASFIDNELTVRKMFSYPPYGTIIKVTIRGKKTEIPAELAHLKDFVSEYEPIYPNIITRADKDIYRMHLIIKLGQGAWVDEKLLAKLRTLPPQFTIEVNPDNLL